ncbi:MAG: LPS export ABC transporter permease LptF [Candidatus Methylomirabilales bacterium]
MRTIDRYIAGEILSSLCVGLGIFTVVLMMEKILKVVDLVIGRGVPTAVVGRLLLYSFPLLLMVTIPMAVLLATITTYSRLAADNEILALKTAGWSLYRMTVPALIIAVLGTIATFYITTFAVPWGTRSFRDLLFHLTRTRATIGLTPGVFNDDFRGLLLYVHTIEQGTDTLRGVFVTDTRNSEQPRTMIAREGQILSDPAAAQVTLRLTEGTTHIIPTEDPERYQLLHFGILDLPLSFGGPGSGALPREPIEMDVAELRAAVAARRIQGLPPGAYAVELMKKGSIPITCLVFMLLGVPLGIRVKRSGRSLSLAVSVGLALVYYILMVSTERLGDQGRLSPFLAAWIPNLTLGTIGLMLFASSARETSPTAWMGGCYRAWAGGRHRPPRQRGR